MTILDPLSLALFEFESNLLDICIPYETEQSLNEVIHQLQIETNSARMKVR